MVTDAMSLISASDKLSRTEKAQRYPKVEPRKKTDPLGFFNEYTGHMERSLYLIHSLEGYERDYRFELQRAMETYTLRERMKDQSTEEGAEVMNRLGATLEAKAAAGPLEVPFALDTKSVAAKVMPELDGGDSQLTGARASVEFFR